MTINLTKEEAEIELIRFYSEKLDRIDLKVAIIESKPIASGPGKRDKIWVSPEDLKNEQPLSWSPVKVGDFIGFVKIDEREKER